MKTHGLLHEENYHNTVHIRGIYHVDLFYFFIEIVLNHERDSVLTNDGFKEQKYIAPQIFYNYIIYKRRFELNQ
jgi:hypothetical protein